MMSSMTYKSKKLLTLDCEVYPNYFLAAFKRLDNGKVYTVECVGDDEFLSKELIIKLRNIMAYFNTFGFNSKNYDLLIIRYALMGKSCHQIFELSNNIIKNGLKDWQTYKQYNMRYHQNIDHFDLMEIAPGVRVGLKLYGGRMHSKKLQDLPIEPGTTLSKAQTIQIKHYCINDLDTNIDLYTKIKDRVDLRVKMSEEYGGAVISKSDAQIAEVVIKSDLESKHGITAKRPTIGTGKTFRYNVPDFVEFKTKQLQNVLSIIENHEFKMNAKGSIELPKELSSLKLKIGSTKYKIGVGGIHSQEKKQAIVPDANQLLIDKDVAAYYPYIILNLKLSPKHLGNKFLEVYKSIVEKRIKAKKEKNKVVNESLKIVINGSFGKLGNKYSCLYSPDLMMTVTITGQLCLLMVIEDLQLNGIDVVSANTDGFVSLIEKWQYGTYEDICEKWQELTGFVLEENRYKALYSRDVNNYLAITESSSKGKGIFTLNQLGKNPQGDIIVKSVEKFLINGVPIAETIYNHEDIKDFLVVRSVTGGAVWREDYLGKVVRWIYSTDGEPIRYKKNGNKVAKSDGAFPIMQLTNTIPNHIDYEKYVDEAKQILKDIGHGE